MARHYRQEEDIYNRKFYGKCLVSLLEAVLLHEVPESGVSLRFPLFKTKRPQKLRSDERYKLRQGTRSVMQTDTQSVAKIKRLSKA